MDIKELRTKSAAELSKMLAEQQDKLHDLRLKAASRQLKNVREVRTARILLARLKTLLRSGRPRPVLKAKGL